MTILIDYEQELPTKGFKNSKISIIDILISLFYYFTIIIIILLPILGFTGRRSRAGTGGSTWQ